MADVVDPACYFCPEHGHASSACPTLKKKSKKRKHGSHRSFEAALTYAQSMAESFELSGVRAWKWWCKEENLLRGEQLGQFTADVVFLTDESLQA